MYIAFSPLLLFGRFFWGVVVTDYACQTYLGGYSAGVPPLPIPNREVKPDHADGNELACQRALGYTAKSPRWAVAYKFKAEQA